ncbi:hypothetical protein JCM10207_008368 [Rhodosporidiobolus poonsookiae]
MSTSTLSPELGTAPDASTPSAPPALAPSSAATATRPPPAAPALEPPKKRARGSLGAASPAPAPPPASSTSSAGASRKIDAVLYAGYEIQAQFGSPYPIEEMLGEEKERDGGSGEKDAVNGKGQARERGGRFGKKVAGAAAPGSKGKERAQDPPEETAFAGPAGAPTSNGNGAAMQIDTTAAALPGLAAVGTSTSMANGEQLFSPELYPPPSSLPLSALLTDSAASTSNGQQPAPTDAGAVAAAAAQSPALSDPADLPFQLPGLRRDPPTPVPSTSTAALPPAPLDAAQPIASTSALSTSALSPSLPPALTADPAPPLPLVALSSDLSPASDPSFSPASATLGRGKGGRFAPKPAGTTQKAQRAAARAAKAAASSSAPSSTSTATAAVPGRTEHLTQRQQRELARQAREEREARERAEREARGGEDKERTTVGVCERCFKYFVRREAYVRHQKDCQITRPPGRRVYQRGATSIWEVDGATAKLYCQNLCLFAKLFIEHKYMFFDVDGFVFYLLTEATSKQEWVLGYFSKEKLSYDDYNLACIVVFPPWRQKGWATLLIEFSYELSRRLSDTPGTPERPLSDLGQKGYLAHWTAVLVRYFRAIFTLQSEPPLIDTLLVPAPSASADPQSSPTKPDDPTASPDRRKRPRRSKGWDGELPPGAVTLSSALSASPAKAFTLRLRRPSATPRAGEVDAHDGAFAFPTTLDDLAEAVNLRAEDVAFAMVESGLAQWRKGGKAARAEGEEEGAEVKMEEEEEGADEPETVVITPELVEAVAREKKVKPLPMLDVAYVVAVA